MVEAMKAGSIPDNNQGNRVLCNTSSKVSNIPG